MENNLPMVNAPDAKEDTTKKVAYGIYIVYILSMVCPVLEIIGVVFAYIFENDGSPTLKSHYRFLIRSFWIGLLYFSISGLLIFLVIGLILVPLCIIWWVIRMAKGLKALMRNEPIINPTTWLF